DLVEMACASLFVSLGPSGDPPGAWPRRRRLLDRLEYREAAGVPAGGWVMAEALATTQRLPSGVILAKDEIVRAVGEFFVSNVFVYLKLNLVLTTKRLAGEKPNTFLGSIPVGTEKVSYPLNNVAGLNTSTRIAPHPLI